MPNWVNNNLTIKKEDAKYVLNSKGEVDFELLCPCPDSIVNTISPVDKGAIWWFLSNKGRKQVSDLEINRYGIDNENIKSVKRSYNDDTFYPVIHNYYEPNNPITKEQWSQEYFDLGERYVDNYEEYGIYTWYDWRYAFWGVKWNASSSNATDDGDYIHCFFETPWGYPSAWLEALAKKCKFHLAWEEEQGYRGIVTSDGDTIEAIDLPMLEYAENEDGWFNPVNDEYGEDWISYAMGDVFPERNYA